MRSLQLRITSQHKAIDEEAKQEVAEAVTFADESPFPEPATLYDAVSCEPEPPQEKSQALSLLTRTQARA